MTQAIFYQLDETETPASDLQAFACYLVAQCYSNNQRLSVYAICFTVLLFKKRTTQASGLTRKLSQSDQIL